MILKGFGSCGFQPMWAGVILLLGFSGEAQAQLFGARPLGEPLSRRQSPGLFNAGQLNGGARYLRQNRSREEFVGSDRLDLRRFVGSQQGRTRGEVLLSTEGIDPPRDRSSQLNQPVDKPGSNRMYYPRLRLGFPVPQVSPTAIQTRVLTDLVESGRFAESCRFEVSVEARTATLQGVVTSAAERDLAELVVLVEPGISAVRNELRVLAPAPDADRPDPSPPVVLPPPLRPLPPESTR